MNRPLAAPVRPAELSNAEVIEVTRRLRAALGRLYPTADRDSLDEVVQDAWTALYAHRERTGERLDGARRAKFLHVAARNELVDRWRQARFRRTNLRGQGAPLEAAGEPASPNAGPEETVVGTIADRELEEMVAEELTEHEAAIFHLRFFEGLRHREITERTGASQRAVGKALARGTEKLVVRLFKERHWVWEKGKRQMIVSVLAGIASKEEVARARKLASHDPAIAQALQDAGTALHGVTVVIPAEVALRAQGASVTERVTEAVSSLAGRSNTTAEAEAITAQVASSGAGRGAGAAGAGLLAKLGALGGAGKTAVACLATTGATATCVVTGVVPGIERGGGEERGATPAPKVEEARDVTPAPDRLLLEGDENEAPPSVSPPGGEPKPPPDDAANEGEPEVPQTEPGLAVPETQGEQVQQEFDLAGAAEPVGGAGGGSGGGSGDDPSGGSGGGGGAKNATGGQVTKEFGP